MKLVDRATLLREQEQKDTEKKRKDKEKADKEQKAREKADKEAAAKKIKPEELFKQGEHVGKYSKFDERGVPTHLADGTEVKRRNYEIESPRIQDLVVLRIYAYFPEENFQINGVFLRDPENVDPQFHQS